MSWNRSLGLRLDKFKNMKQKLFILIILFPFCVSSQNFEINSLGKVFYNKKEITKNVGEIEVLNIFGKPDRVSNKKANIIWTYDSLGYFIYIEPNTRTISAISINYVIDNVHHYPIKKFDGSLTINNPSIKKTSSLNDLKKIKTTKWDFGFPVFSLYYYTTTINIFSELQRPKLFNRL